MDRAGADSLMSLLAGVTAPASSSHPTPLTPSGSPNIPGAAGTGKNTAGFMGVEAFGAIPTNITARDVLKNLDSQFLQRYIIKLEEAKSFLKAYLAELDGLSKRLEKTDSAMRMVMGEAEVASKKAAITETVSRLTSHQKATYKRMLGNG